MSAMLGAAVQVAAPHAAQATCRPAASLPVQVLSALAWSGLAPRRLELEITESVLLSDSEINHVILRRTGRRSPFTAPAVGRQAANPYLHRR
jgi:predicted signal transduction protein with EAL and GGDEF domain